MIERTGIPDRVSIGSSESWPRTTETVAWCAKTAAASLVCFLCRVDYPDELFLTPSLREPRSIKNDGKIRTLPEGTDPLDYLRWYGSRIPGLTSVTCRIFTEWLNGGFIGRALLQKPKLEVRQRDRLWEKSVPAPTAEIGLCAVVSQTRDIDIRDGGQIRYLRRLETKGYATLKGSRGT